MSVWFCIPSARSVEQSAPVFKAWRKMGYKIAIVTDDEASRDVDLQVVCDSYPGYANSVNYLAKRVLAENPDCDWIVCGGDDTYPDPNVMADDIADQCFRHFEAAALEHYRTDGRGRPSAGLAGRFGVMQPTGDRWADCSIERICGSPWMGREFCERINGGNGPLWHEYRHMFVDNELQEVATKLGILLQRRDLTHLHHHFSRVGQPMPEFLKAANSQTHWDRFRLLFESRRAAGFPGHEPITA